jgi:hypothetical protein
MDKRFVVNVWFVGIHRQGARKKVCARQAQDPRGRLKMAGLASVCHYIFQNKRQDKPSKSTLIVIGAGGLPNSGES